jgi:hyperosmotically inducible protein
MWIAGHRQGGRTAVRFSDAVRTSDVWRIPEIQSGGMDMKSSKSTIWIATALFAAALTSGCNREETATSDAGSTIDQARDSVGEKMDQAASQMQEQAANAGDNIDDAAITAKVKTALVAEPGLKALQIDVDTADGVVMLSGAVDSPSSIDRATQVVQAVPGVKSVDNRLTVRQS